VPVAIKEAYITPLLKQESPANAKGTRDSSACMKAPCEQM